MKEKICGWALIFLVVFSQTAGATHWVYIGQSDDTKIDGISDIYVDQDSVGQKGDQVVFWEMEIYNDAADGIINVRSLYQIGAITAGRRQFQIMKHFTYDANGQETAQDTSLETMRPVTLTIINKAIDFSIRYAGPGQNQETKPKLPK
jgi:hypothetical protein